MDFDSEMINSRIVLITGKGGVGRTSISAGLAIAAARSGRRVLLAEIGDSEQSESHIAHAFGRSIIANDPEFVGHGVRACSLQARKGHELFLSSALPAKVLIRAALRSSALNRFLTAAPSFNEMGIFYHLLSLLRARTAHGGQEHELLIVDMPATGHTLALTGLPEILLRLIPGGPIARLLREGQGYLNDPDQTRTWVVALPELLPVSEALELIEGLHTTSMPIGGVFLNRVPKNPFSDDERAALEPLLEKQLTLGMISFKKLAASDSAYAHLKSESKYPITRVSDHPLEGPKLAEALAPELMALFSQGTAEGQGE